ncbi:PQQ-binding-like beta-propeller repeat protein [Streptomyces sp. NPDC048337]|uniref:outer membrane protein assembly factor BamB family protein n=1 Tax=Streptomyces sp. NPDC048337 TaxID=3365535 RepID=UPI003713E76B
MTGRTSGEQPTPGGQLPSAPVGFGPPIDPAVHGAFGPQPRPEDPATPAPSRDLFADRPGTVVLAVLVAVLLAIGGGVFVTVRTDGGHRLAQHGTTAPAPSGSASVDQGDGKGPGVGRDVYDPNVDIKPGEARVWFRDNQTDVAGGGVSQFGPWRVGDVVVRAMFKEVAGYAVADGQEKWKIPLPTPICGAPRAPSADGKLVLGLQEKDSGSSNCTDLQQIDLTTGKAGWKAPVPQENRYDFTGTFELAITGDTVAVGRTGSASAFSVADGHKLFATATESGCYVNMFAGGPRLLAARTCLDQDQVVLQELDPATGTARWSHMFDKGWKLGRVLSADPIVVAAYHKERNIWHIIAFTPDGKVRSQGEATFGVSGRCNGWGNSGGFQDCYAAVADADTLYIGAGKQGKELGIDATNQVVAVDLNTGKEKWRTAGQPKGRTVWPLAIENGRVVVYVSPGSGESASVVSLAPADGSTQPVLQSPAAAAGAESVFYTTSLRVAWAGGRLFLLNGRVYTSEPKKASRALLSFGK